MSELNGYDIYEDFYYDEETGARVSNSNYLHNDENDVVVRPRVSNPGRKPAATVAAPQTSPKDEPVGSLAAYVDACRRKVRSFFVRTK